MVFQSYELFPHLTVLDNVTLAPQKVAKRPKDEVERSRGPAGPREPAEQGWELPAELSGEA